MKTERDDIQWIGNFTAEDQKEIGLLRSGQAAAVEQGDADAYVRLCADDVHSMLPGHDIIAGRDRFHAFQSTLFRAARFDGLRKYPLRVERSGDLAVEVGRQEIRASTGTFAKRQKYTHVMRKSAEGWRFVILMSNGSE